MKIVSASYEILTPIDGGEILKLIEKIGRVCYKSEERITETSAPAFVKMLINRGHEAMLEHYNLTVKFITDRGVSHEIVRHRVASFAQESTRYCNYKSEVTFIDPRPVFWPYASGYDEQLRRDSWRASCEVAEEMYMEMLDKGATPQEARSVLPNSLKTEIVVTANLREWRHILKLRTASVAHPQMREIMCPLLDELKILVPVVFEDITY